MKKLSMTTILAIALAVATSTNAVAGQAQGTLTAVFHNDCNGYRQVGVNANMLMEGGRSSFNMNVPQMRRSRNSLWLNCGQKVTKTLNYDIPRRGDYKFQAISSTASYVDEWRNNQRISTVQQYSWPADSTTCTITYKGWMTSVAEISCSKQ